MPPPHISSHAYWGLKVRRDRGACSGSEAVETFDRSNTAQKKMQSRERRENNGGKRYNKFDKFSELDFFFGGCFYRAHRAMERGGKNGGSGREALPQESWWRVACLRNLELSKPPRNILITCDVSSLWRSCLSALDCLRLSHIISYYQHLRPAKQAQQRHRERSRTAMTMTKARTKQLVRQFFFMSRDNGIVFA